VHEVDCDEELVAAGAIAAQAGADDGPAVRDQAVSQRGRSWPASRTWAPPPQAPKVPPADRHPLPKCSKPATKTKRTRQPTDRRLNFKAQDELHNTPHLKQGPPRKQG
jgi:hypothetical protein